MNDLNSVYIVGRLTADPTVRPTSNGEGTFTTFTLANNNFRYDDTRKEYQQDTSFFDVALYGKENEKLSSKLKKGLRIGVNGHLKQRSYTDKEGAKKQTVGIISYTVQILDPAVYAAPKAQSV